MPLSNEEKIWLLDEVVSTAFASWLIYLEGHEKFADRSEEEQTRPEHNGYTTLKALLSHSLMAACYALVDTRKNSYSMHHAVKDRDLIVTRVAEQACEKCCDLRRKIATYRNNVTAHVNSTRTQADWAQYADIKNGEISDFLQNARTCIEELGRANLHKDFVPSSRMQFRSDFRAFCRVIVGQDE
ncbi:MAG TPA: hypothetical protein VIL84_04920 [Devosiaceae bacterium]